VDGGDGRLSTPIQEAVLNFATVLYTTWPTDYTRLVIFRVLVEAK
jgi:hypothetical protein